MAHSVVTANDWPDLMGELELFAESQGWTVDWNTGTQIGLHSGNCYAAWGTDGTTNPRVETDTYPDPDVNVNDYRIYGSLGKSFAGHASHYWGLSGSPVTSATDADRVRTNDMTGPFSEVHFFGDSTYIWVVVRSDVDRWTHFGFGVLDKQGMTHPDIGFMCGNFWRWWDNNTHLSVERKRNFDYSQGDEGNRLWMMQGLKNRQLYIPDGVLDPAYGIADDLIQFDYAVEMARLYREGKPDGGYTAYSEGRLLSHWPFSMLKPVTGGLPLLSLPVMYGSFVETSLLTFLGDMPGIRLCDVSGVGIGEDIVYGSETYLAFPLKRRSTTTYDGKAGTYGFGVAFKKD